ncbi:GD16422 [Drosophila simulans]|uniref:GD16422 n=1 Tax=Drosophila simulans TaxID=7240 RepID=B4R2Z3_DROSI|nr:GD16422 [Drosophila simulans]
MQRARLLQSVWMCRQRLGQLPGGSASSASLAFRYATKPATPAVPLLPLQMRSLGTGGVLSAAERRSRRPASFSEKPKASVADAWTQLEAYYRQHDLINFEHCQRLLELLQESVSPLEVGIEELHFLLGSCVPELLPAQSSQERLQLFKGLWAQLIKLGQPTLAHYHTKLQVLRQNRLALPDYRSFLAEIAVYHGAADSTLYGALLDVAGAAGNMRMATEILSDMRERSLALTEHNFHALLLGNARSGDLPGAESVLASMRAAGIQPGSSTQALWFEALVENSQVAQAKELLQAEHGFTAPQLLQMLRGLLASKDVDTDLIQLLVKDLPREFLTGIDLPPAIKSLGMLRLVAEMRRLRVECDEETLRHYLFPHLRQTLAQPLEAVKALESAGVKPSQTLCPVVSHLLQQHQMSEVLDLLDRYPTRLDLATLLQPLSSLAVNARATKRFEVFAKVIQALQQKALKREEDFVGSLLLQMTGPQTRLRQDATSLRRFLHELRRLELQISPAASEALLSVLRHATDDADLIQDLAKTLQKMKNPQLALPADTVSLHGGFIKHPRDMSIDELECHLVELESKQLNPRGVLRRLLQLSVRSGRLERAQQLLAKCQVLKVQESAGMMASILDLHIKLRDLPRAQESLERLSSTYPAFQIDEHKVIDYAALLVQGQQLEAAKQLLQRRAEQHKVVGGDYVMKNVWQLLTNVGQLAASSHAGGESSKQLNQTREWLDFLRGLGYCQSHNALLGPVVREWLLKGDLDAAVAEFQRLANTHKHTPLQFELLSLLVRLGNGDEQELARFPGVTAESAQQHLAAVTATEETFMGRDWIVDTECRHHHKRHCEQFVYPTYDEFKKYLAKIICCAPNCWRTFRPAQEVYRRDFRCCSMPHSN